MHRFQGTKQKQFIALLMIAAAIILLWNPVNRMVYATRLASSMQKLSFGTSEKSSAVKESLIRGNQGLQSYEAMLYRPLSTAASSAIILVPGISKLGCYHPRLVALSRSLAEKGILVITPDIKKFREFEISAEPVEQILFWHDQVKKLEGSEAVKKTGLAGISYSGTLALIAAARPEIRNQVGFVVAIGPYYDLVRCTRNWFAADTQATDLRYYPTRFYAKWIIMLAALDMIDEAKDRIFLHDVIDKLLLQEKVPPAGPGLTSDGLRWYQLATMKANQSDPELSQKIEEVLTSRIYRQLDPKEALSQLKCPVFLIHGAYDNLIPPGESREIHGRIAHSHLLISPFLTHTHPTDTPLSFKQKAKAVWDTLLFCYQFAKAIRQG
jgi:pimeloyl-ACP methyl ester carboxylesterase